MYTPPLFNETDLTKLHETIEKHSFAVLVSQDETEVTASHLPLLLDRESGEFGRLIGHMARANRQWQNIAGQSVLAIFNGPHSYISPTWYEERNVVPTWNYIAVHASGIACLIEDRERSLELVKQYVEVYEANIPEPWSIDSAEEEFVDKLLDGIVAFEIDILKIEGKWKLSQNHDLVRRQRVIEALNQSDSDNSIEIAKQMSEQLSSE